jgi:hypothetical protein
MTVTHDALTAVPSGEKGRQPVPVPGPGGVRLSDRTLRHLRLVPSLLDFAAGAWRSNPVDICRGRNWAGSIMVITDQPEYDRWPWLDDQVVVDGDVEDALGKILADTCEVMTPPLPEDPRCDTDRPEPMEYDVALSHRGRILAVVRHSPLGPVVSRLDRAALPSEQDHVDAPISVAGTPGSASFRRMSWVSTPQTRAVASRLVRQKDDRLAPWMWSVMALMGGQDPYRDRRLPAQEFSGCGLSEAVDAVITMACEAMLPVSPDRSCLDPDHPEPLAYDVALACCGRIHAVVQHSPAGPIVTVFDDATPMMKNGPSAEEVAPT